MQELYIQSFLKEVRIRKASDLLLTAGAPPQLRINGILQPLSDKALAVCDLNALMEEFNIARLRKTAAIALSGGERRRVGLCADCKYTRPIESTRGSTFYLCLRSASDRKFPKYPCLPVVACSGYEPKGASPVREP